MKLLPLFLACSLFSTLAAGAGQDGQNEPLQQATATDDKKSEQQTPYGPDGYVEPDAKFNHDLARRLQKGEFINPEEWTEFASSPDAPKWLAHRCKPGSQECRHVLSNLELYERKFGTGNNGMGQVSSEFGLNTGTDKLGEQLAAGSRYAASNIGNRSNAGFQTQVVQAIAAENPDSAVAQATYGQYALKDKRYSEALAATARAMKLGDSSPSTLTTYAGASYGLGNYAEARRAAQKALEQEPSNRTAESLFKLSEGKAPQTQLPSVMDRLDKKAPESAREALSAAGQIGATDIAAAIPAGAENLQVMPSGGRRVSPAARQSAETTRLVAAKLQVKDYAGAKELADKAIAQNPDNAQAYAYRSMAENRLGHYEAALKDANASLSLAPDNTPSLLSRALAHNRMKNYPPALEDSEKVLEREPRNSLAYLMKAYAEAGLGKEGDMRASLEKAAAFNPAYQGVFERALQLPKSGDALFLFEGDLLPGSAPAAPAKRRTPVWPFVLAAGAGLAAVLALRRRREDSVVVAGAEPDEEPAAEESPLTGFQVVRRLGAGGMGEVFEARDVALDRRVAVKRMREEIQKDPRERERFLAEARLVAKLRHPAIVEIHSVLEAGEDIYLVFEYVDGRTAGELLAQKGRLPFEEARRIVSEAGAAVDYAHAQGVIHRDLKPANIMLDSSGAVKVMDFGVARQAAEAMSRIAMTNTVVGTPPFMAPEQEQGVVCRESDVFALGICLYELLSGELPFSGSGAGMLLAKTRGEFVPLSQRLEGAAPAGLDAVMSKALAPTPEGRYRSAGELSAALAQLPRSQK